MRIPKTGTVQGEENAYQALADAIVLSAVRDYRNAARMLRRLKRRMFSETKPSEAVLDCLISRVAYYEHLQKNAELFFCSATFAYLCDLDGRKLLRRLEIEVA